MRNLKDKKIIIYKKSTVKDSAGFSTTKYKPLHPGRLWAYVRQLSANEFYVAKAVQQTEEMFFTINWRNDVNPADCSIEYKGIFYGITRVDTFEGYKEDLKLYASKIATQPKPGDLTAWDG
jgi:SPP1 family predicted phage head-tail adaptor